MVPLAPPERPFVTTGALQELVVPEGILFKVELAGVIEKAPPLQVLAVKLSVMLGLGLTIIE